MSAQDVVKRFLPPLPGKLCDQQAQRLLTGLAAAGYAVVKLPEPDVTESTYRTWGNEEYDHVFAKGGGGRVRLYVDDSRHGVDEARLVAAQLLAAADYAEGEDQ